MIIKPIVLLTLLALLNWGCLGDATSVRPAVGGNPESGEQKPSSETKEEGIESSEYFFALGERADLILNEKIKIRPYARALFIGRGKYDVHSATELNIEPEYCKFEFSPSFEVRNLYPGERFSFTGKYTALGEDRIHGHALEMDSPPDFHRMICWGRGVWNSDSQKWERKKTPPLTIEEFRSEILRDLFDVVQN